MSDILAVIDSKRERAQVHVDRGLVESLSPGGEWRGADDYYCLSPLRSDNRLGSFHIHRIEGTWLYKDFASGDGGDIIELAAQVWHVEPLEAARRIAGDGPAAQAPSAEPGRLRVAPSPAPDVLETATAQPGPPHGCLEPEGIPTAPSTSSDTQKPAAAQPSAAGKVEKSEGSARHGRPAARELLLRELARLGLKLGRDGEKILAKCPRLGYVETHVVGSSSFRRFLLVTAEAAHISISRNGLDEVEDRLLARGFSPTTPAIKSYIRVARVDRDEAPLLLNIVIDTGRDDWRALHISAAGVKVVESADPAAPWFFRPAGFEPLAEPDLEGADLARIWRYVNIVDRDDRILLLVWIVHTFRIGRPAPLLAFIGEQGGAKSSSSRALRRIIDPSAAPLLGLPKDERDLFSLIECGHIIAFDNVSSLPDWLSDLFAAIVTGTGRIVRALYTDNEARLFRAMRALIVEI